MASAKAKIRHLFGDTFSCRAAPPDILVKLSGIKTVIMTGNYDGYVNSLFTRGFNLVLGIEILHNRSFSIVFRFFGTPCISQLFQILIAHVIYASSNVHSVQYFDIVVQHKPSHVLS